MVHTNPQHKCMVHGLHVRVGLGDVLCLREVQRLASDPLIHVEDVLHGRLEVAGGVIPCTSILNSLST